MSFTFLGLTVGYQTRAPEDGFERGLLYINPAYILGLKGNNTHSDIYIDSTVTPTLTVNNSYADISKAWETARKEPPSIYPHTVEMETAESFSDDHKMTISSTSIIAFQEDVYERQRNDRVLTNLFLRAGQKLSVVGDFSEHQIVKTVLLPTHKSMLR